MKKSTTSKNAGNAQRDNFIGSPDNSPFDLLPIVVGGLTVGGIVGIGLIIGAGLGFGLAVTVGLLVSTSIIAAGLCMLHLSNASKKESDWDKVPNSNIKSENSRTTSYLQQFLSFFAKSRDAREQPPVSQVESKK